MLVDSGAEISIIAIKGCPMEAADQVKSVSGIGEARKVGPKTECKIRFTCDTEKEYSVWLHATFPYLQFIPLSSNFHFVALLIAAKFVYTLYL